jgi:hypothetical protein
LGLGDTFSYSQEELAAGFCGIPFSGDVFSLDTLTQSSEQRLGLRKRSENPSIYMIIGAVPGMTSPRKKK